MAAHTYWRLSISANAGDANYLSIAEIEMRATMGGADQCTGGTATASTADTVGPSPASNAFDNNATTRWATTAGILTGWIRYQFASPVEVTQYTIQAHPTTPLRSPKDWALEYSDDGSAWVPVETRAGVSSWSNGEIKTYTVPAMTHVRVSQIAVEVLRTNTAVVARVSQIAVEVLRPNVATASSSRPVCFICT